MYFFRHRWGRRGGFDEYERNNNSDDFKNLILSIIDSIVIFGNHELFVINTSNHALISLNALPMSFRYDNDKDRQSLVGSIALPFDKPAAIPKSQFNSVLLRDSL